ncbi:ATP-binding protein [Treponema sp. J25]|uniref:ATP-binding protein n=1 Tax=Treponema sp. J25 TaxID=2094121 RepID=UPI001044C078|nr:ATP-binding protein [Treponema sp. J25]TCW60579.1 hypothetical protein C5O22_10805 [Treponema sp. J25]
MSAKKLPIGLQTLSKILSDNYYYVDKTRFVEMVARRGGFYFLSRPRRFGKSLFLDTLAEALSGNKELFKGLYLYDKYDFTPYPVIRLSFGSGDYKNLSAVSKELAYTFKENYETLGLVPEYAYDDYRDCFKHLIKAASERYEAPVAVLIDEYDKPILDNLSRPEVAREARDILKNLYSVLKDSDRYLRLAFITGVSKFSKLSLFSGLNNLEDITLNPAFGEICGYTQHDLETVFADAMEGSDMHLVQLWYNGYWYFGEKLYNPFDILLFLSNGKIFSNYWWQTGSPSFLIEVLKQERYFLPELENCQASEELLNAFDVDYIDIRALLWQTGYLTIKDVEADDLGGRLFRLGVPNAEVLRSLNELLLRQLGNRIDFSVQYRRPLIQALEQANLSALVDELKRLCAGIPYNNYVKNDIATAEGYWASLVYVFLAAIGYRVSCEDATNQGRIDMTIETFRDMYIIEFKVDSSEPAIKQIEERRYWEKYQGQGKRIHLLGINFSSEERNITDWEGRSLEG